MFGDRMDEQADPRRDAEPHALDGLYRALSRATQAMLRIRDEPALLQEICAIASGFGAFPLAWIGMLDAEGLALRVAARSGPAEGFLQSLQLATGGDSPTGAALDRGEPQVANDFMSDPRTGPWHARAARFGIGACAAVPIRRSGRVAGTLSLYAARPGSFDQETLTLLGEIADCLSFALDDLDREAALAATAQQVRRISVAVEQGPVTVVITNLEGAIEYVNPRFTDLTGYSSAEALGRNPRMLQSGQVSAETYRGLWAALRAGQVWKGEFLNRKKNGDLFWEAATIAPIRDARGAVTSYVAVKEDITERRQAKLALEQLNGELEERIRRRTALLETALAELDAFSYSVSHDLRAPLRSIDGFSQALLEECGGQVGAAGQHYLQRILAGTRRMGRLIDDLLKLSQVSRSPLNRQRLDLSALARTLLEELAQGDPARTLDLRVAPGLEASGDPGLIRAVLANLLGNAWKYTARTGRARIEVFREDRPDGGAAFCVRDNGAGFDMAYAGKLFTAFQRLHSASEYEGSGIGLALVQRIVRRHGGQVWATGAVGEGACFRFTLPEPG